MRITRTEYLELLSKMIALQRAFRQRAALDVFADTSQRIIEMLTDETSYVQQITDERFKEAYGAE